MHSSSHRWLWWIVLGLLPGVVFEVQADGPGAYRDRLRSNETAQETRARDAYDEGVGFIAQAEPQHGSPLPADRSRAYEQALARFEEATRIEPTFYEAHTYVGYVNRKLNRHERALEAYATALRLKPDFFPAIEYQGEAFLGLDRFEAARFNYLRLYATAPTLADKLLDAMQAWVTARKKSPGHLTAADVATYDEWVTQRVAARILVPADARGAQWTKPD